MVEINTTPETSDELFVKEGLNQSIIELQKGVSTDLDHVMELFDDLQGDIRSFEDRIFLERYIQSLENVDLDRIPVGENAKSHTSSIRNINIFKGFIEGVVRGLQKEEDFKIRGIVESYLGHQNFTILEAGEVGILVSDHSKSDDKVMLPNYEDMTLFQEYREYILDFLTQIGTPPEEQWLFSHDIARLYVPDEKVFFSFVYKQINKGYIVQLPKEVKPGHIWEYDLCGNHEDSGEPVLEVNGEKILF